MRESLLEICRDVHKQAEREVAQIDRLDPPAQEDGWEDAKAMVVRLWAIEAEVARRVGESVRAGVEF